MKTLHANGEHIHLSTCVAPARLLNCGDYVDILKVIADTIILCGAAIQFDATGFRRVEFKSEDAKRGTPLKIKGDLVAVCFVQVA